MWQLTHVREMCRVGDVPCNFIHSSFNSLHQTMALGSGLGWKHKAIFVKFEPILEVDNDPVKVAVADNLHVEPEPTISFATLVEERFWNMPQKIKETCDAIYIVVVFLEDLKQWAEEDRQKMDSYFMSKHGSHLVSDMALLENQLLLDHTINVVQKQGSISFHYLFEASLQQRGLP